MTAQGAGVIRPVTVDPWDPGYGMALAEEMDGGALQESSAELILDLEQPAGQWRPVDPDLAPALRISSSRRLGSLVSQ